MSWPLHFNDMEAVTVWCCTVFHRTQRIRGYVGAVSGICTAFLVFSYAVKNLSDPEFVTDMYCQQNSLEKEALDIVEDGHNTICRSEIVLTYRPADLGPPLRGTLNLHAVVSASLAVTGLMAWAGHWRDNAPLIWPWLAANCAWALSLIITAIVLGQFGFSDYVCILLGFSAVPVLTLLDAGHYSWKLTRQQGAYEVKPVPVQDFGDGHGQPSETSGAVTAEAV